MRVLIVDDSGAMRSIQRRCLNKLGVSEVIEAEDFRQAVEAFESDTFDVVLCDGSMPRTDGIEVVREIRRRNESVPVFLVTTPAERVRVVEALQSGVTDYLVKPFTPDGLREKLDKWCAAGV